MVYVIDPLVIFSNKLQNNSHVLSTGICYGFEIMEDAESPNVPFTILRTRFHTGNSSTIFILNTTNARQWHNSLSPG